ncbi:MAG: EamA family transporter [Treponema sp.]|nr:EamA family transporter [Treponema sp.]
MIVSFIILVVMTIIASFGSFLIKKASNSGTIIGIFTNKYLYISAILYLVSSVLSMWLLKRLDYSIVVPLNSLCIIWTMLIAYFFLKEKIGIEKIIGVLLIISGVICINI